MELELRGDYLRGGRTELEKTGFRSGSYGGGQWGSANRFWLEVDVRGFEVRLASRVQVEVRFRISSCGLFEWTRAEEMCVSRWVRQFFCAIRRLVHPA